MGCVCVFVYMLSYEDLVEDNLKKVLKGNTGQLDAAKRDVFSLCYSRSQYGIGDHESA